MILTPDVSSEWFRVTGELRVRTDEVTDALWSDYMDYVDRDDLEFDEDSIELGAYGVLGFKVEGRGSLNIEELFGGMKLEVYGYPLDQYEYDESSLDIETSWRQEYGEFTALEASVLVRKL